MAYTVRKLAELSGITVRTLHHYDDLGLLKPAYTGVNGYRYYEEAQLLRLQQILFFRELGFSLKKIQQLLGRSDFDTVLALRSHREVLSKERARLGELMKTIDKTINRISGENNMADNELYKGFSPEKQADYEKYLVDRFGKKTEQHISESKQRTKGWTDEDMRKSFQESAQIMKEIVELMGTLQPEDPEVQQRVRRHFTWLQQFWTPDQESYIGHSQLIEDSELRQWYDKFHPQLANYFAQAIRHFAKTELK